VTTDGQCLLGLSFPKAYPGLLAMTTVTEYREVLVSSIPTLSSHRCPDGAGPEEVSTHKKVAETSQIFPETPMF
jgi:hypothetical protein